MQEQARSLQWLMTTLRASTALTAAAPGGVYDSYAPAGTATPFVIVQRQSTGQDITGAGHQRFMNRALFTVKVVGEAAKDAAMVTAADAIDAALDRQSGATADGHILACVRENDLEYPELVNGSVLWKHLGGEFTVWTQPA